MSEIKPEQASGGLPGRGKHYKDIKQIVYPALLLTRSF
jgi:hypothetical protein